MIEYNKSKPLILIHIPKTAGISVREIYKEWFGDNLLFHYFDGANNKLPKKHDIFEMHTPKNPFFVYGHFNRERHFGIEQYYPEVDQFITILREPFEIAVSGFFYVKKINPEWRVQLKLPEGGLTEFIENLDLGLFNYFPCDVTADNYREVIESYFVEVGVTEYLDESMQRIAKKLKQEYIPGSLGRLNTAKRDQEVTPEVKARFIKRHQLEYDVYNYVLEMYAAT